MAVTSYRGEFYGCYVADRDAGQIVELDAEGETVTTFSNLPNIRDLAFHRNTQTLWAISVSENEPRLTVIYTTTEEEIDVEGLRQPNAIAINQNRGEVWIADYGYEDEEGVLVIRVEKDSIAEQAGIAPKDLILGISNYRTSNIRDFRRLVGAVRPGRQVTIHVKSGDTVKVLVIR